MATALEFPRETEVGSHFVSNYPPYSIWRAEAVADFEKSLAWPSAFRPLSLYLHLPFCAQRCSYCYFRVYPRRDHEEVDRYIDCVLQEASLYAQRAAVADRPLVSAYFGGGSPTYLSADQIDRLIVGLRERLSWSAVEEFTVECDPGTTTPEKLDALRECGVSRLSLGFQSLDQDVLETIGRRSEPRDCLRSFALAREAGFAELNIDLLAGLPGQTEQSFLDTIDRVIDLEPECVTIYQMELSYNSRLNAMRKAGHVVPLASWPDKRRWVGQAFAAMEQAGYVVASGYMCVRDPSRWRFVYTVENYWHGGELVSLGDSAFGYLHDFHYQNVDSFEQYVARLNEGRLPVRRALQLGHEEMFRRELILHLKTGVIDCEYFREKFGVDVPRRFAAELQSLAQSEYVEVSHDFVRLTREGLLTVDWLLPRFYQPQHLGIRYT